MDLARIREIARAAKAYMNRPFEEGEVSRPYEPLQRHLDEAGWREVWSVVRALREQHGGVFNLLTEEVIALETIELMAEGDAPADIDALAASLRALATKEGPWLVQTPLVGIDLAEPVVELDSDSVLERAYLGRSFGFATDSADADEHSPFAVNSLIGDSIARSSRWYRVASDTPVDTGRAAAILSTEQGTVGLALPRARARGRYAIAVWVLLSPPGRWHLTPSIGVWVPQPSIHWPQRYKLREYDGRWGGKTSVHGGVSRAWANYQAPTPEVLRAPYEAFAEREERHAHALLSATFAWYASCYRDDATLSEQLRDLRSSIDVLCESSPGARDAERRWANLISRYELGAVLGARGYQHGDIRTLSQRLRDARNIAAHGADAALLDLGWPSALGRQLDGRRSAQPQDLGFSALRADLAMIRYAVRIALTRLWAITRESGWKEDAFEAAFAND